MEVPHQFEQYGVNDVKEIFGRGLNQKEIEIALEKLM